MADDEAASRPASEDVSPGEKVTLHADDGAVLKGTLFGTPCTARMAVVLHPAAGVACAYYAQFAEWLALTHAAVVLTYDYRDFGGSAVRPTRQSRARMSDWGIRDQETALAYLVQRFAHLPVRVIGHSLGAQWLAFHRDIRKVDRAVAVASGPNYWVRQPLSYMPAVVWFWWIGGPIVTRLLGYLPGWVALGQDLPGGVYWQWRRWCLSPRFSEQDWGASLPAPKVDDARFHLTLLPVADDVVIPPQMVRRLPAFYPRATVSEDLIEPSAHGLKGIGHLRLFAPRNKPLWPRIAAPLVA